MTLSVEDVPMPLKPVTLTQNFLWSSPLVTPNYLLNISTWILSDNLKLHITMIAYLPCPQILFPCSLPISVHPYSCSYSCSGQIPWNHSWSSICFFIRQPKFCWFYFQNTSRVWIPLTTASTAAVLTRVTSVSCLCVSSICLIGLTALTSPLLLSLLSITVKVILIKYGQKTLCYCSAQASGFHFTVDESYHLYPRSYMSYRFSYYSSLVLSTPGLVASSLVLEHLRPFSSCSLYLEESLPRQCHAWLPFFLCVLASLAASPLHLKLQLPSPTPFMLYHLTLLYLLA